jgi:hypothetical protein
MTQSSKTANTATIKREVREALKFAGFAFSSVTASACSIRIILKDAADRPAVLKMYPDAAAEADFPRIVTIRR